MNPLAAVILGSWRRNGAYALRLVGDLTDQQMVAQPVAGRTMNHPAWILSHLNVYSPICVALIRGEPFEDPQGNPFGPESKVSSDPSVYPSRGELVERYRLLHDEAERALESLPATAAGQENPLERWRQMSPTVGHMLVTLMVKHESGHLGQFSAWRRAMGLPRVAL